MLQDTYLVVKNSATNTNKSPYGEFSYADQKSTINKSVNSHPTESL